VSRVLEAFDHPPLADLLLPDPYAAEEEKQSRPPLDWSSLPFLARPSAGGLPEIRLRRKCQQLESTAAEVVSIIRSEF